MMNFSSSKDIFGFDRPNIQPATQTNEDPLKRFNLEEMMSHLREMELPGKNSSPIMFVDEVKWGDSVGAVRVWTGSTLQLGIDKLCSDLEGNPTWVTKKFYQINRAGYGGFEKNVAQEIFEEVEKIDKEPIDAPKNEYKELPNLVLAMATKLKRQAKDIFIYEGIRKVNDYNYIIKFGVRGQGVEARDHQRIVENLTDVSFNKDTGKIRVMNYCVKTKVGGHNWKLFPADQDWYFMPSQPKEEILEVIATNLKWY